MNKKAAIVTIVILAFASSLAIAIYLSFWQVLPATRSIKETLAQNMAKIVSIPQNLGAQTTYEQTLYNWEMETPQGEVTALRFYYNHAFEKNENEIVAVLESPEGEDASIFTKVLPAVITDEQSLKAALDPPKANLDANKSALYRKINLATNINGQTTRISWIYNKEDLRQAEANYNKLKNYPASLLRKLYRFPSILVSLAGG